MNTGRTRSTLLARLQVLGSMTVLLFGAVARSDDYYWIEGESTKSATMNRHPWWYDQVDKKQLSSGDWISNFSDKGPAEASYELNVAAEGDYDFWVHANPTATKLSYRINDKDWQPIVFEGNVATSENIAADKKIDLRFIAWVHVGKVHLSKQKIKITFRMHSENNSHGGLDCFVFSKSPFTPKGLLKPDQFDGSKKETSEQDKDWFAFQPPEDPFDSKSAIDLRYLNEKFAGENGWIQAGKGTFVHEKNKQPVRFWAVNGPHAKESNNLSKEARTLAKYGVNLVRSHGAIFDKKGNVDSEKILGLHQVVDVMKAEGIYTHISFYFPLWFNPTSDLEWIDGYDGSKHPFATLYFNSEFQDRYRSWIKSLLTTPNPKTGKTLVEEPALFGLEIINEDSFFFWTFNQDNIPDAQLRIVEKQFGDWLVKKYGSLDKAFADWGDAKLPRDQLSEGRVAFRPLWNISHDKTVRDKDTAAFLAQKQRGFYESTYQYMRKLGFKGMITCSNWATADPQVLGPIEKYTYTVGDFIDRHGYFGCQNKGDAAEWSIREGHTYVDRSALRFESESNDSKKMFVHPGMDPSYDDKPSMISETTWNRPNRYRGEAPLYFASYGALQDSDAIVHFAKDGIGWEVKPNYFMQPWTIQSPAMMGQFPAAALIYRKGLIEAGKVMAQVEIGIKPLMDLEGTPLPQDAAFDELRLKDIPSGSEVKKGQVIDPLIHFVGQTKVAFSNSPSISSKLTSLKQFVDHENKRVRSSHGQLTLDYQKGLLLLNSQLAQGASGNLKAGGKIDLIDLAISSESELAHFVLVSLDGIPIGSSSMMLLQVMTEEKATGFDSTIVDGRLKKIERIGEDPWQVKNIQGTIQLKRKDAEQLKVKALDDLGMPKTDHGKANEIKLLPTTLYYLISK